MRHLLVMILAVFVVGCGSGKTGGDPDGSDAPVDIADTQLDPIDDSPVDPIDDPVADVEPDNLEDVTADVVTDTPMDTVTDVVTDPAEDIELDASIDSPDDTGVEDVVLDSPGDVDSGCGSDLECDDLDVCTSDVCDLATGACSNDPVDEDADGHAAMLVDGTVCGGDDCDDTLAAVNTSAVELCFNSVDDDCNGQADCGDSACFALPACAGGTCGDPLSITGTGTYVADTTAMIDAQQGTCQPSDGSEIVYELILTEDSDLHVDTQGSSYDTVVYVRSGDCTTGTQLGCNDDVRSVDSWSRVELGGLGAGTYWIIVDSSLPDTGGALELHVVVTPVSTHVAPSVHDDPLVHMPGTHPNQGVTMEGPGRCFNCHDNYDPAVDIGTFWKGSMMSQASRDFLFWATMAVSMQDSKWAVASPNAADICLRCHFPQGWVEGRSDPVDVTGMTGSDYDGVHCDVCHQKFDPFFEDTYAGTREGNDWVGYFDEVGPPSTLSQDAADDTYVEDIAISAAVRMFNGNAFFNPLNKPFSPSYTENGGGQFYVSPNGEKRASFADNTARHTALYSRHHKSRYTCGSCHDVSNPVLQNLGYAGTAPGDGITILPTEEDSVHSYYHVERTFSEFMLSDYGLDGGSPGRGFYDPAGFSTSVASNNIARCQDCHMPDALGKGCDKSDAPVRSTESVEHPSSGMPTHDLTGGNMYVSWVLASTVSGSSNHDPINAGLLAGRVGELTMDLTQGEPVDPDALLAGVSRAHDQLRQAARITDLDYTPATGALTFRVVNDTGHKLISGYPEGRRMFVNIQVYSGGSLIWEVNPYDVTAGTFRGLDPTYSPASPGLGGAEEYRDDLVYEMHAASSLTGELHTFHFALATHRYKDNRIPPKGFRIGEAPDRLVVPVDHGTVDPGLYSSAEYTGGYDQVDVVVVTGGDRVEVKLYYQSTSREYNEFLRDELNGEGVSLPSPSVAGSALTYVAGTDPFFDGLRAWGDTVWDLWVHNMNLPGVAPVLMTESIW